MAFVIGEEKANINYSVQGLRGGQPHPKQNVGNVTIQLDKQVTIEAEAFTTSVDTQERTRRDKTLLTIQDDKGTVFCGTSLLLCDIMREYYNVEPTDQPAQH